MRRLLIILAATAGGIAILAAAVLFYAAANLDSIIAGRKEAILAKAGAAIGREVKAADIKAKLGWGVSADVSGVAIAGDPAVSSKPFVQADDVYAHLELMPLLAKRIEITELVLEKPVIRIVRTNAGTFNVSTIGAKREPRPPAGTPPAVAGLPRAAAGKSKAGGGKSALGALLVKNFTVENGTVIYEQQGTGQIAAVNAIDLQVRDFNFDKSFTADLAAAAFGKEQNLTASATIGPLLKGGKIDPKAIPLSATLSIGPIALSQLNGLPQVAKGIPRQLSMPDPVTVALKVGGTIGSLNVHASSDLTGDRIAFGDAFNKLAGVPFTFSGAASLSGEAVKIKSAQASLGALELKASDVSIGGGFSAHIDTNNFDLASVAKLIPALAKYNPSGKVIINAGVRAAGGNPEATGALSLSGVSIAPPGGNLPRLSNLSGKIELRGATADIGPLTFNLGAAPATLTAHADSIWPAKLNYDLSVPAQLHLAELVPSRPASDEIDRLTASGNLEIGQFGGPFADTKIASPSGNVNRVPYQNLNLEASLQGDYARLVSLKIDAFSGNIAATGGAALAPGGPFTGSASFTNLNLQPALESQDLKAAQTVRGTLGGNLKLAGKTGPFDAMKPALKGGGQLTLTNGKLIGVNAGADALKKVRNLPAIGNLVPQSVISRHPELFNNPDTDIQIASLSFVLTGPRIVTHDLKIETADYSLFGDGWFDLDKNLGMAAQIVLAQQFSGELIAARKNARYLADRNGQITVPLQLSGQLPKPAVVPDVAQLAQRASERAAESQGRKLIGKFLKKKGLGGLFGGGNSAPDNGGGAPSGNGSNPPPNPLDQLKKLF